MPLTAWVTRDDLPDGLPGGEAALDAACGAATAVLYGLTGRRWAGHATRSIEIRADRWPWWWRDAALGLPWGDTGAGSVWGGGWGLPALPVMAGGELYNTTGGHQRTIRLPDYPIRAVTAVAVGGAVVDPATYWLEGNRFLTRHHRSWPSCGLADDRTMTVDYDHGADPPAPARHAAARLATELARAAAGQNSGLPGYVTQRVRQGETISYTSAAALFDKGRTGLADVDLWLATVNPAGLARRSRAWSPDTDPAYRTTPTGGTAP
jgi:hypothetical protein